MNTLLEKDFNDTLAQMMQVNQQVNAPTNPQPPVSTHVAVNAPVGTPEPPKVDVPVVAATATPVAPVAPVIDLNAVVDEWDNLPAASAPVDITPSPTPVQSTNLPDFTEMAKVLNLGEFKSKEELVKAAQELKQKAESLGALPSDLAKAVEIANLGGNYLEYLSIGTVDWAKEDPIVLYENYVIDRFSDENGNVNTDKVDEFLDHMNESEKELRGRELQSQYIMIQKQQKQTIEMQAQQAKAQFEQGLRSAIDSVDNIAGFKLSPSHKAELYKEITSGADLKHNDLKSRVEMAALRKYWTKMDEYRKTQIKNATLRQTLEEATFPKLNSSTTVAAPETQSNRYTPEDYIKDLAKQRGFNV